MNEVDVLSPEEFASRIPDGATIALTGSGVFLEPDALLEALERRFLSSGHPRDLTIVHALGIGDGRHSGLNRLAHEGMVRKVVGGHWSWSPTMQRLARDNLIAAYSLPGGVISTLLRESGAGRPGLITRIGLGTFADPRLDGGRCNARADEKLVEVVTFDGQEYLRYKPLKIDFALVRGTEADSRGNISLHREPTDLDCYTVALSAHNCGGKVFAQVEEFGGRRTLPARLVRLPGILVNGIVLAPEARKTYLPGYDPHISGEAAVADVPDRPPIELPTGVRRVIAERALRELGGARSVNFGYGIPGGIPALLKVRDATSYWGTIEQGIHNGEMLDGPMFGSARDPDAIIPSIDQFDFYSGGGIDVAFLGMGELDAAGDVNVSKMGGRLVGPGGFVDITQTARKVVFCGTFEAKGLEVEVNGSGTITIARFGEVPKLVRKVEHVTFSGRQAMTNGQEVIYITERAVFRLCDKGIELVEIPSGVHLERDVIARMAFRPIINLRDV